MLLLWTAPGFAHPEDEFCTPGEDGIDPALCLALREMDRPATSPASGQAELDAAAVVLERGPVETFATYLNIGVGHILPGGLDHILFVVAFFLSSTRLRTLMWQIGAFTVAHTITLGLAASGTVSPPAAIVEPFIALTIVWVAVENLWRRDVGRARTVLVFLFGLVHGLGFAGFFGELGLPSGQFLSALIGFNVGVELGQIAIVLLMVVLTYYWRPLKAQSADTARVGYRRWVVTPLSAMIAALAAYWFIQRIAL
ncbi:MAG: HupE/UreJ family protein [Gammaproteobacteria bacterium]